MTKSIPRDATDLIDWLRTAAENRLPGLLGIEIVALEHGRAVLRCDVDERHLAPNGYLHAASVIALADTAAGFGCLASRPQESTGFTTIELKSNHVGTLLEGGAKTTATLIHGGRTTQVWDAVVEAEQGGKKLAYFRCTQLLLY